MLVALIVGMWCCIRHGLAWLSWFRAAWRGGRVRPAVQVGTWVLTEPLRGPAFWCRDDGPPRCGSGSSESERVGSRRRPFETGDSGIRAATRLNHPAYWVKFGWHWASGWRRRLGIPCSPPRLGVISSLARPERKSGGIICRGGQIGGGICIQVVWNQRFIL